MNLYRVYGHTSVNVIIEVEADSEEEAYKKANETRCCLESYVGNGGMDKLVGVDGDDESVAVDENIYYDDIELLSEDN